MTQLALSDDVATISAEITIFKQQAGQAVLEIGRRLKHVKDNDLVHGQWYEWLKSIDVTPQTATRFIQVVEQFGNRTASYDLPVSKMFEMLSLPESIDRQEFVETPQTIPSTGEQKMVNDMTVKELREVKKALQEAELRAKDAENEKQHFQSLWHQAKNQPPKVVKETVTINVLPPDYNDLKKQATEAQRLNQENAELSRKMLTMQQEYQDQINRRDEVNNIHRKMRESFKNILSVVNQEHYNARFFFDQISGTHQSRSSVETFLSEFGHIVDEMFREWKELLQSQAS